MDSLTWHLLGGAAWTLYGIIYIAMATNTLYNTVQAFCHQQDVHTDNLRAQLWQQFWFEVFLGPLLFFRDEHAWQYTANRYFIDVIEDDLKNIEKD